MAETAPHGKGFVSALLVSLALSGRSERVATNLWSLLVWMRIGRAAP